MVEQSQVRTGAIYAYRHADKWMYVGSVQDQGKVERRHKWHLKEKKWLIGPWLRETSGAKLEIVQRVRYENVEQLFACENVWIDTLETMVANGGLNQTHAGGRCHEEIGRLGAKRRHELYPEMSRQIGYLIHERYPNMASEIGKKWGRKGGLRTHELHPNHLSECGRKGGYAARLVGAGKKGGAIGARVTHARHPHIALENLRRAREKNPNMSSDAGKRVHELYPNLGFENGTKYGAYAMHVRWHVNRSLPSPTCEYCQCS